MSETLDDYDKDDGWSDEKGCEICPHCGDPWSMNGGMQGPAFNSNGVKYTYYIEADPGLGPFFCGECYQELETAEKRENNQQLTEWSE